MFGLHTLQYPWLTVCINGGGGDSPNGSIRPNLDRFWVTHFGRLSPAFTYFGRSPAPGLPLPPFTYESVSSANARNRGFYDIQFK